MPGLKKRRQQEGSRLKQSNGQLAQTARWRGTGKEPGVAAAEASAALNGNRGRAHLHQNDGHGSEGDGSRGVHDDAQGALVGAAVEGVDVSDLDNGEQGQQGETHKSRRPEGALFVLLAAGLCPESDQINVPCLKNTQ